MLQFTAIMHITPDVGIAGLGYKQQLIIYRLSKAVKSLTAQKLLIYMSLSTLCKTGPVEKAILFKKK